MRARRHWDNPAVLEKLSAAMGDAFNPADLEGGLGANGLEAGGAEGALVEEEEGGEDEGEPSVHSAASSGALGDARPVPRLRCCMGPSSSLQEKYCQAPPSQPLSVMPARVQG